MTKTKKRWTKKDGQLLVMAGLGVVFLLVFCYLPMFGIWLAFTDGDFKLNIMDALGAPFVGFDNFANFLNDIDFKNVVWNTLGLNLLQLAINFPVPIIFALLVSEIGHKRYKKFVQTVSYFPFFLSWVVYGNIILALLDSQTGVVDSLLLQLHLISEPIEFGGKEYFWGIVIISSILKGTGWGAIVYFAAIAGIDQSMYEAARIDGANRWHRMYYITLPSIMPTVSLFLILSISGLLNNSFDQIWVLQNQVNLERSEVIDTFVYKYGLGRVSRYSYATAVGLFKSVIAAFLLLGSNWVCKKITGRGVF